MRVSSLQTAVSLSQEEQNKMSRATPYEGQFSADSSQSLTGRTKQDVESHSIEGQFSADSSQSLTGRTKQKKSSRSLKPLSRSFSYVF